MGVGNGARVPCLPKIFLHGTDIVGRRLIVLFFGLFSVTSTLPPRRGSIVLFFALFCYFSGVFLLAPWKFFYRSPCVE